MEVFLRGVVRGHRVRRLGMGLVSTARTQPSVWHAKERAGRDECGCRVRTATATNRKDDCNEKEYKKHTDCDDDDELGSLDVRVTTSARGGGRASHTVVGDVAWPNVGDHGRVGTSADVP